MDLNQEDSSRLWLQLAALGSSSEEGSLRELAVPSARPTAMRRLQIAVALSMVTLLNCWTAPSGQPCSGWQRGPQAGQGRARAVRALRLAGGGAVVPCLPLFSEELVHGQLIRAAKNGHIDQMHRLVRQGAAVNCSNERGQSPLIRAAERGHTEAVVALLKLRADIGFADRHGSTALHYAAFNGHKPTVQVLLKRSEHLVNAANKYGFTPLHYAAADGHAATVSALVSRGADVNHVDNMQLTALHRAAAGGHVSAIHELVRSGSSVHGAPPALSATATPRPAVKVVHGKRAVARENSVRSVACLDLLVAPVQDVPAAPSGNSTGALACVKTVGAAAAAEADNTDSDSESDRYRGHRLYTPLHEAAWCNQPGSVKALVSLGAAVLAQDKWGKTPLGNRRCPCAQTSCRSQTSPLHRAFSLSRVLLLVAWAQACVFTGNTCGCSSVLCLCLCVYLSRSLALSPSLRPSLSACA